MGALGQDDVGRRVVVRHRRSDGRADDALGELVALSATGLAVRRDGRAADGAGAGELVRVALADVVAARRVPERRERRERPLSPGPAPEPPAAGPPGS